MQVTSVGRRGRRDSNCTGWREEISRGGRQKEEIGDGVKVEDGVGGCLLYFAPRWCDTGSSWSRSILGTGRPSVARMGRGQVKVEVELKLVVQLVKALSTWAVMYGQSQVCDGQAGRLTGTHTDKQKRRLGLTGSGTTCQSTSVCVMETVWTEIRPVCMIPHWVGAVSGGWLALLMDQGQGDLVPEMSRPAIKLIDWQADLQIAQRLD